MATSKELRVGVFVLAGLIVAGIVVFLIGDEKRLFATKVVYHTDFRDVQGLKVGAPVRLGGVDIGMVSRVGHSDDPRDSRLHVDLHVVKSEATRIRQGSTAEIVNKGLLGDKMVEVKEGPVNNAPLPSGSTIPGQDAADFASLFADVGTMAQQARQILQNLESGTRALLDVQMQEDLRSSVHSVRLILNEAAQGKGYLHRLLSDPTESERISKLVASADRAAAGLDQSVAEVQRLLGRVNQGPGFAHDILYGEGGADALSNLSGTAAELTVTLKGIREGKGLARSILFGGSDDAPSRVAHNLASTSDDLKHIVADLRAGKGTLGALLVDSSIYEDAKRVLGDVERNDALRALVRYSIKQDEKRRPDLGTSGTATAR